MDTKPRTYRAGKEHSMAEWQSGDVVANGIKIHYYRTGGDKPPVVLSHGFSDDGLCWTRVARALEADYDVIMPDARGHGLSEAPEDGYTAADRAADLAAFIQVLGLEKPAIGGHSMGGSTTLYCAALYPEAVGCAILEDPGIRLESAGTPAPTMANEIRRTAADARASTREQVMAMGRKLRPNWDEVEFGPWADAKQRMDPKAAERRRQDPSTWQEMLAKITCPTLLVTSDPALGGIVTPEAAALAQQILPSLKVVRLNGAGHNIRREAFEPFVAAVRGFLAEAYVPR
jgi:pimeloyl-ACP methyl ester carboxylesterase